MRLKPHDEEDGYRVWLSDAEAQSLIDELGEANQDKSRHTIAGKLGVRAGLRRDEAAQARPADAVTDETGDPTLRVWEDAAKLDKYRETPIPSRLKTEIDALADIDDIEPDESIIGKSDKTLNRWVKRASERLYAETGDEGWQYVTYHDLRRTWGTRLLEQGVLPTVVMTWGGWDDWDTFRKHYLGEFSPEAMRRERGKVEFLNDGLARVESAEPQNHLTPVGSRVRSGED